MKKLLSVFMILSILAALCCNTGIRAQAAEIVAQGSCGASATWKLDRDGNLEISGTGLVWRGWGLYKDDIKTVTFNEGITEIGMEIFWGYTNLTTVSIPSTVTYIDEYAFEHCDSIATVYISDLAAWNNIRFVSESSNPTWYGAMLILQSEKNYADPELCIAFNVDTLPLPNRQYTDGTAIVDGIEIQWTQLNDDGSSIQMLDSDGKTSMLWNTQALPNKITKIEFVHNSEMSTYNDHNMIVKFGNAAKEAGYTEILKTSKYTDAYVLTPDINDYTFFCIEWDDEAPSYWDSIKVYYADEGSLDEDELPPLPIEPDTPAFVVPNLKLDHPSLSFEDEILYNVYFTVDDVTNVTEMGMITFADKQTDGTIDTAEKVIKGYLNSGSTYMVQSEGIPAKNLGDALYFKVYAKLTDGSYVYSDVAGYHAVAYADSVLSNEASSAEAKALVVSMLNYGAAAQTYFDYKTDRLMNAGLTDQQQALVQTYNSAMVQDVVKADSKKVGIFKMKDGYANIYSTVSFEGAFSINFYFASNKPADNGLTFYYWDAETYAGVDTLTPQNATGVLTMKQNGQDYGAAVAGIAAKDIDETVYVAGFYTSNGVSYPTNIIAYSLGNYCKTIAANGENFGAATAVYGFYAKNYFAGIA